MTLRAFLGGEVEGSPRPLPRISGGVDQLFAESWNHVLGADGGVDYQLNFRVPKAVRFTRDAAPEIIECYEHPKNWKPKPWEPGPFFEEREQPLIVPTRVWICFGEQATPRAVWLTAEDPCIWPA